MSFNITDVRDIMSQLTIGGNPLMPGPGPGPGPEPAHLSSCPGLNPVKSRNYRWIVPYDATSPSETYCKHCADKLGIRGTVPVATRQPVYCHGYLKLNKGDNGVFNISFWQQDFKDFYPITSQDGIYYVSVPSGGCFTILINNISTGQKDRVFRFELDVTDAGGNEITMIPESKIYCELSSFARKGKYGYVDNMDPAWNMSLEDRIKQYGVLRPGDTISVKFYLYDVVSHDFMLDSNRDMGPFKLTSNRTIVGHRNSLLDRQQFTYDKKPIQVLPFNDYVPYNKKPLVMKFTILTDTDSIDTSDILLKKVYSKISNSINTQIASCKAKLRKHKLDEEDSRIIRQQCEQELADLEQKLHVITSKHTKASETGLVISGDELD